MVLKCLPSEHKGDPLNNIYKRDGVIMNEEYVNTLKYLIIR